MVVRSAGRTKLSIRLTVRDCILLIFISLFRKGKNSLNNLRAPDTSLLVPGEPPFGWLLQGWDHIFPSIPSPWKSYHLLSHKQMVSGTTCSCRANPERRVWGPWSSWVPLTLTEEPEAWVFLFPQQFQLRSWFLEKPLTSNSLLSLCWKPPFYDPSIILSNTLHSKCLFTESLLLSRSKHRCPTYVSLLCLI